MGGLFSWLSSTDTATAKKEAKYAALMAKYNTEVKKFTDNFNQNLLEREALIAELQEKRNKIIEERAKEIITLQQRYEALKAQQKIVNLKVGEMLVVVLFNYDLQLTYNSKTKAEFKKSFDTFYDRVFPKDDPETTKEVYEAILMISPLLPLFFPTGYKESGYHQYTYTGKSVNTVEFVANFKGKWLTFIHGNLREYVYNVCACNCYEWMYNMDANAYKDEYGNKCREFINSVGEALSNDDLVKRSYEFIKQFTQQKDIMRLKLLSAKSMKGISTNRIEIVPRYYPKTCPTYELWESLLMLVNTLCYNYGYIVDENNNQIHANSLTKPDGSTNGGQCYKLPEEYSKKCLEEYFDLSPAHVWKNDTDYIEANEDNLYVPVENIVSIKNLKVWMSKLDICDELTRYNTTAEDPSGYLKYLNPTRMFTTQILQDDANPLESYYLPRLAVSNSEIMKSTVLYDMYVQMTGDGGRAESNTYDMCILHDKNAGFFYSGDYLITTPSSYRKVNNVNPIAQATYKIIMANAVKWSLYFPIDTTMTFSKINSNLLSILGNYDETAQEGLPQMIWAGSTDTLQRQNIIAYNAMLSDVNDTFNMIDYVPNAQTMTYNQQSKGDIIYPNTSENYAIVFDEMNAKQSAYKIFDDVELMNFLNGVNPESVVYTEEGAYALGEPPVVEEKYKLFIH